MKTIKEWEESGLRLTPFLSAGDIVEPSFADWALNIMPPAFWSDRIIQVGEPASHAEGKATFATFYKDAGQWHFGGYYHRGKLIDFSSLSPGLRRGRRARGRASSPSPLADLQVKVSL